MEQLTKTWNAFLSGLLHYLPSLLGALVILVVGLIAARLLPALVGRMLSRTHIDAVAVKYILRTVKIVVWSIIVVMALDKLGVPVTSLLAVLAATGAAVALAIKDNLSNLASGIVLLFSKPFKAGDFIEVDGTAGTIREIELMHTYLDTVGNMRIAIPNTKMMTATITNYSVYDTRRMDFTMSVDYGSDIPAAKAALLALTEDNSMILTDPEPPRVIVKEYADSAVVLLLRLWCKNEDYWELQFQLSDRAKPALDAIGVSIPFPQLDVHLIGGTGESAV